MQLTNEVETQIVHAPVAAGTTDVTDADVIDMQGFDGCRFIVGFGAITSGAVTSVKVKQATAKTSDTELTSGSDIEGSSITVADTDDNKAVIIDIRRPRERYLQVQVDRGTQNAVVDFAIAEKYGPAKLPVTKHGDIATQELHVGPAEGTA